jgi:hypothetical protein
MGVMDRNVQSGDTQQFEQAIATMFTCRSVIKYNAALNEEQKKELLAEIDAAAQFLQERMVADVSLKEQASFLLPPLPVEEIIAISQVNNGIAEASDSTGKAGEQSPLHALYKLYYAFLKKKEGRGVDFFVSRFNEVMAKLNDVQFKIEKDSPAYFSHLLMGNEIDQVRGFVTDLYCMFTEFASAISGVVEGRDIDIDTEKVSSTSFDDKQRGGSLEIAPLVRAQQTLTQFKQRNGILEDRVADAAALLIMLEDLLDQHLGKREEIADQINNLVRLLNELALLLAEYEQTIASLLA